MSFIKNNENMNHKTFKNITDNQQEYKLQNEFVDLLFLFYYFLFFILIGLRVKRLLYRSLA